MPLTGPQIGRIYEVILAAFEQDELERVLLTCMDVDFSHVATGKNYSAQVLALVRWISQRERTLELLGCVHAENPANSTLAQLHAEAQTWSVQRTSSTEPADDSVKGSENVRVESHLSTASSQPAHLRTLTARMQDVALPATDRLEAGLRADSLGALPRELDSFVSVADYNIRMGRYLVTNVQFRRFMDSGGYASENEDRWWSPRGIEYKHEHDWAKPRYWDDRRFAHQTLPVVGISWYEAEAYCNWLSEVRTGLHDDEYARLPMRAEWEAAARSGKSKPRDEASDYPWHGPFDLRFANTQENDIEQVTPVHMYPAGATPEGVFDLAGNVWEWMHDPHEEYSGAYWLKGGAWFLDAKLARTSVAGWYGYSWESSSGTGFRIVVVPSAYLY